MREHVNDRQHLGDDCVCIVGSGPTGTAAALALVEAGIPVVMLESGRSHPRRFHLRIRDVDILRPARPSAREVREGTDFVNPDAEPVRWFRTYELGGLSNYWSGIVMRYAPEDFTEGERLHEEFRWPVSYEDVEPYYARVERIIRVVGGRERFDTLPPCEVAVERAVKPEWERIAQGCRAAGRALAVLPQVQGPRNLFTTEGGPENVALHLLQRLKASDRFRFVTGAHATRVLLDEKEARANGVEYIDTESGKLERISAGAVILAAGALSSTGLLLRSRSPAFPDGLGNEEGLVGRHLHAHPLEYGQIETDFRFSALDDRRLGGLYITRPRYADAPPLEAGAFLLYGGSFMRLSSYFLLTHNRQYFQLAKRAFTEWKDAPNPLAALARSSLVYICWFGTQLPSTDNHVSLHPDRTDSFGLPLLSIQIRMSAPERALLDRERAFVSELFTAAGAKIHGMSWESQPMGSSVHYGGTVRMHESPRYGVLDQWNRLHSVRNLLVVDASAFTTCVEKNPTLTSMALATRAADHLSRQLRT